MDNKSILGAITAGAGALYGYFAGLDYKIFLILSLIMVSDIIIGVLFAMYNGDFSSLDMKKGIIMKILLIILLFTLVSFQLVLHSYNIDAPFANVMAGIMAFMEMFSILETFAENDVVIPEFIMKWFRNANDKLNGGEDEDENKDDER